MSMTNKEAIKMLKSKMDGHLRPERFKKFDTWYMNYKKKTLRVPCFEDVWEAVKYFKVKDKFW